MFIKYQKVRNAVVGTTTAIVGGVAAFFGLRDDPVKPVHHDTAQAVAVADSHNRVAPVPITAPVTTATSDSLSRVAAESNDFELNKSSAAVSTPPVQRTPPKVVRTAPVSKQQLYAAAMKIATSAAATPKGKDVLGGSSPWKLNLYDDNNDGQWDRGKLDNNRDEVDDENWTFKQGRWEKDGGAMVWNGSRWTSAAQASKNVAAKQAPVSQQDRYRQAMKIATSRARTSKGKDVLGPASPWKLNLYDDNGDGQWDRGKLDYDRDEVDDEKWTFKKGRWEKDGGTTIWTDGRWASVRKAKSATSTTGKQAPANSSLARYRQAMGIATSRATSSKGKDVLGPSSPWKLNLYDDNKDGQWDRGKLDYDRDEVDDEKWNFKQGRWEKDGGAMIWNGADWQKN